MSYKKINKYKLKNDERIIIFADIETIFLDDKHTPISIGLAYENNTRYFECIDDFMKYILLNKDNSIIYFHNFGRFDSTFIIDWIIGKSNYNMDIDIIERNNVIYQISLKKYNISFRDSYLILNMSLESVGRNFCKEYHKEEFDYQDINKIYNETPEEVHKQCINDCLVLQEGFINFRNIVLKEFGIDIKTQLTLPSLAFNLFKYKYYDVNNTPISKNPYETDSFIRRSYKGGVSEVFKPRLEEGYCYDANSLYPTIMFKNKMPIGKGKFVGKNDIDINNFIGFIECKVKSDKEINFLTYRHPKRGLITPMGEWVDVYYHEEVKKAIELGYEIDFVRGFKYEDSAYIFKGYVEDLYQLRINSKTIEMNMVAKLLLNSLYGRFGMNIFVESTKFIKEEKINEMKKDYDIKNISYIGHGFYSISGVKRSKNKKEQYKNSIDTETAVQIASSITALSRIFMYDFKTIEGNRCYYTDTDSIFLKKPLKEEFLGSDLGKFKLEYNVKEGIFIAPKVYYVEKDCGAKKFVIKGVKKEEIKEVEMLDLFRKIIDGESMVYEVNRTNFFKRSLEKLKIIKTKIDIKFKFPFIKRIKVLDKGKWVSTKACKIKNF